MILYLNLFSVFYFLGLFFAMRVTIAPSKPSKYLSYLIFIPIFNLLHNYVLFADYRWLLPYTFSISSISSIFFGLVLRLHLLAVLNKKVNHFSVGAVSAYLNIIAVIVMIIQFIIKGQSAFDRFVDQMINNFPAPEFELHNTLFYISQLIIFIEIASVIFRKLDTKDNTKFNIVKEAYLYSKKLFLFIIMVYLFTVAMYFLTSQFLAEFFFLPIAMNLFYLFVLFTFTKFNKNFWSVLETNVSNSGKTEQGGTTISNAERAYLDEIDLFFREEKPYLDSGFNQRKLFDQTGIPIHQISSVINTEYKMNFSDYVNSYRIDFAKELLSNFDDKKETIENVAFDAGFNSKASFYRAFKRHTSTTPKDFISNK
ncbi:MAG: helix-turn-helix domain-containing protein [Crocinitomicaceae bacterium]|nr:helix-turn-helix domain-containing protein [Crocinitomicaceae bacterium]